MNKHHKYNSFSEIMEDIFNGVEEFNFGSMGKFPAANIRETQESFAIDLVVPGRTKDDIKIHQEKNQLTVSSEKKVVHQGETFRRTEFRLSPFKRTFRLPETADTENIAASYDNGILTITIAKKENARVQREINID